MKRLRALQGRERAPAERGMLFASPWGVATGSWGSHRCVQAAIAGADNMAAVAKFKGSSKRSRTAAQLDTSEPITLLVRRGALRRYDALKRKTAGLPVVVDWDRRLDERRSSPGTMTTDRRRDDRRTPPSFTWELADFVIVAPTAASAKAIADAVNGTSDDDRED